jgi:hypothetical protein
MTDSFRSSETGVSYTAVGGWWHVILQRNKRKDCGLQEAPLWFRIQITGSYHLDCRTIPSQGMLELHYIHVDNVGPYSKLKFWLYRKRPVPVAVRSNASFCGRSLAGIAGSNPVEAWISVCCECSVLSGRGLCDELITRPDESYRPRCIVVCDVETSWMRRSWPTGSCCTKRKMLLPFSLDVVLHFWIDLFIFLMMTATGLRAPSIATGWVRKANVKFSSHWEIFCNSVFQQWLE